MMKCLRIGLLCLLLVAGFYFTSADDAGIVDGGGEDAVAVAADEFIPTNEWQVIKEGQGIPPGLWVRMNMTSGVKTARLLPPEEQQANERKVQSIVIKDKQKPSKITVRGDEEEDAFSQGLVVVPETEEQKKEKADAATAATNGKSKEEGEKGRGEKKKVVYDPVRMQEIKDSWSAIEAKMNEAAEALGIKGQAELNTAQADVEKMRKYLTQLHLFRQHHDAYGLVNTTDAKYNQTEADVVSALEGVEDLCHQYDHAIDMALHLKGLPLLYSFLEDRQHEEAVVSETEQQKEGEGEEGEKEEAWKCGRACVAAWAIGTAAQNNPLVQTAVVSSGGISILLKVLDQTLTFLTTPHFVQETSTSVATSTASTVTKTTTTVTSTTSKRHTLSLLRAHALQAKVVYALSSILQHSVLAQAAMHEHGGVALLERFVATVTSAYPVSADAPLATIDIMTTVSMDDGSEPKQSVSTSTVPVSSYSGDDRAVLQLAERTQLRKLIGLLQSLWTDEEVSSESEQQVRGAHDGKVTKLILKDGIVIDVIEGDTPTEKEEAAKEQGDEKKEGEGEGEREGEVYVNDDLKEFNAAFAAAKKKAGAEGAVHPTANSTNTNATNQVPYSVHDFTYHAVKSPEVLERLEDLQHELTRPSFCSYYQGLIYHALQKEDQTAQQLGLKLLRTAIQRKALKSEQEEKRNGGLPPVQGCRRECGANVELVAWLKKILTEGKKLGQEDISSRKAHEIEDAQTLLRLLNF